MKSMILGAALLFVASPAVAAPAVDPPAAVRAYSRALQADCASGTFVWSELERLYEVARTVAAVPTPEVGKEMCLQTE